MFHEFDNNKFNVITSWLVLRSMKLWYAILSIVYKESINGHFADVAKVDADILEHSKAC